MLLEQRRYRLSLTHIRVTERGVEPRVIITRSAFRPAAHRSEELCALGAYARWREKMGAEALCTISHTRRRLGLHSRRGAH
jgi:hypothetical protein